MNDFFYKTLPIKSKQRTKIGMEEILIKVNI